MQHSCAQCRAPFEITQDDLAFYDKLSPIIGGKKQSIPPPTFCPDCRQQRRLAWRNERKLYRRTCDLSGETMLSMYAPGSPFPVYGRDAWFGDGWDPRKFGREYDLSRPFFEQFQELQKTVPRLALVSAHNENCDYCNVVGNCRNCFLIFGSIRCEDCYYGNPYYCENCVDSLVLRNSQQCYECTDSEKLYECSFCQNCGNSQNLQFCFEVTNSHHCFGCSDIARKEYCLWNEQLTKKEYERRVGEFDLQDPRVIEEIWKKLAALKVRTAKKYYVGYGNENVTGDYIFHSKDCRAVFNADRCQDLAYCSQVLEVKDGMDAICSEEAELVYEVSGGYGVSSCAFSHWCWDNAHGLLYCSICTQDVKDCFGCISLRHAQHCILNKQYTKEEYEALVPTVIDSMRSRGEWGEFFPAKLSPSTYNETIASDYFPLSKEQAQERGYPWNDALPYTQGKETKTWDAIPQSISDVPDTFTQEVLACTACGKNYKIIPQELAFLKQRNLPLPRKCPDCRYVRRLASRNPRKLWARTCNMCKKTIQTSYAPERPEIVYCGECYVNTVY
ncbi:MAG: hypothetical protein Q7R81_01135 [Candidatus Peregrinibacteria bacterium]|nr:hypothetical protein [Candidatus Peregrinibacteria bacterium]